MKKYQEALNKLKEDCDDMYHNQIGNINLYSQDADYLDTLQELIDICSKPNVINSKLDHIQELIDSCYDTDSKGKPIKSEFNDNVDLANEELQDVKRAYSFRVEDTRIVNELKELLGVNVDFIKTKVQELIEENQKNLNYIATLEEVIKESENQ